MKKEKGPSPVKAARKAIQKILLAELNNITAQLQKQGITTDVDAEKEAKKLAKKITKGAKFTAAPEAPKTKPVAAETKATDAKIEPAKVKAAPKAPEKKAESAKASTAPKAPVAKAKKAITPAAAPAAPAPKTKTTKANGSK